MQAFLRNSFVLVFSCLIPAFAFDGIVVSVHADSAPDSGLYTGAIVRHTIVNSKVQESRIIYARDDARCISISPFGSRIAFIRKDGKICIKSTNVNGGVAVLTDDVRWTDWIDWPSEEWIYYLKSGRSTEAKRVNLLTRKAERLARLPRDARHLSVSADLRRFCIVTDNKAACYSFTSATPTIVLEKSCRDAALSPSGSVLSVVLSGDAELERYEVNNARKPLVRIDKCDSSDAFWRSVHQAVNSDEWILCTQEDSGRDERHLNQVVYAGDGSVCLMASRNSIVDHGYDFCGDLWIGDPIMAMDPRPLVRMDTARVVFTSQYSDTANPGPQQILFSNGGAQGTQLPRLRIAADSPWVAIEVLAEGNAQAARIAVDRVKAGIGNHAAQAVVTGAGIKKAVFSIEYAVLGRPELASVKIYPESLLVKAGQSQQCSARVMDQYGRALEMRPPVRWFCESGGAIDRSSGLFTAGNRNGSFTIITEARADTVVRKDSATVTIIDSQTAFRNGSAGSRGLQSVRIIQPLPGSKSAVGAPLHCAWRADTLLVDEVLLLLSFDNGKSWRPMAPGPLPSHAPGADTGSFSWVVPPPPEGCKALILHYLIKIQRQNTLANNEDTISLHVEYYPGAAAANRDLETAGINAFGIHVQGADQVVITIPYAEHYTIDILGLDGKHVVSYEGIGPQQQILSHQNLHAGVYFIRAGVGDLKTSRMVMIGN